MTRLAKQLPWDHPIARKLNHEVHRRKMAGKSLYERRKALSNALFDQIVRDQSHKSMICCRHAKGPLIAPVARDTSNYPFVGQIRLKTLLL